MCKCHVSHYGIAVWIPIYISMDHTNIASLVQWIPYHILYVGANDLIRMHVYTIIITPFVLYDAMKFDSQYGKRQKGFSCELRRANLRDRRDLRSTIYVLYISYVHVTIIWAKLWLYFSITRRINCNIQCLGEGNPIYCLLS